MRICEARHHNIPSSGQPHLPTRLLSVANSLGVVPGFFLNALQAAAVLEAFKLSKNGSNANPILQR